MEPKYIVREKDLDQNLQVILEKAKGKIIWGVVKGDGYGLGLAYLSAAVESSVASSATASASSVVS